MSKASKRIILAILLACLSFCSAAAYDNFLTGRADKIQFDDVSALGGNYWARDAIYVMSSLGIIKGYDEGLFLPEENVSRAEALALIYRAVALEEQAQAYADVIDERRQNNPGTVSGVASWADGYIQLAYNNGLISKQQYDDAMRYEQHNLAEFDKSAGALREEIAFWVAKALNLSPPNNTNYAMLKTFNDYGEINTEIAPYFDAVVSAGIMQGSANRFLYPKSLITRAEMAKVLQNFETHILLCKQISKKTGKVTAVQGMSTINIQSENGDNDYIYLRNGENLIVITEQQVGGAQLLNVGDDVDYYINEQNEVLVVKTCRSAAFTAERNTFTTSGIVQAINVTGRLLTLYDESGKTDPHLYRHFNLADESVLKVTSGNHSAGLRDISQNDMVFLKVVNGYVNEISFAASQKKSESEHMQTASNSKVTSIYRATLGYYDEANSKVAVSDIMRLESRHWGYTKYKGFAELFMPSDISVFYDNSAIERHNINEFIGAEIYMAIGAGTGGNEDVLFARISSHPNNESQIYSGEVKNADSFSNKISLQRFLYEFNVGKGTIIVKDGKLATINDISYDDSISFAALGTGWGYNTFAAYVDASNISERGGLDIYHAVILNVDVGNTISVRADSLYDAKSYSWIYSSRKMLLKLTGNTKILDEKGVVNNRDISTFSDGGRNDTYVNIVVKDDEAVVISKGDIPQRVLRGKIGAIVTEDGAVLAFNIYNAIQYADWEEEWREAEGGELNVRPNTIYIKNGAVALPSDVKVGDSFTAFYNGVFNRVALIIWLN
ncbi:MAG: S-layer homology domain-containing protein [Firmicutes bacterium]|nr:S-layer homology domain-containing protein [Bacillota bacterium]